MCARHGRGAIEICLSEKGALAKKDWETLLYSLFIFLSIVMTTIAHSTTTYSTFTGREVKLTNGHRFATLSFVFAKSGNVCFTPQYTYASCRRRQSQ